MSAETGWPIKWVSKEEFRAMYEKPKRDRSKEPLTLQALNILGRLQQGPATSLELQRAARCVSHTARIAELRRRGHEITCKRERQSDGGDRCTYTLHGESA